MSYIYLELRLAPGAVICLMLDHTKTGAKDGPMYVVIIKDMLCSMSCLGKLSVLCDATSMCVTPTAQESTL